jgi:hypothetical protein
MNNEISVGNSIGVRLQRMAPQDQTIALARLAEARVAGPFASIVIRRLYDETSLPTPTNISDILGKLARKGLTKQASTNPTLWRLTPLGRHRSHEVLSDIDLAAVAAEAAIGHAAVLGRSAHTLFPPTLAPVDLIPALHRFLSDFPFDTNIFAMTRFPDAHALGADPVAMALKAAAVACELHGFHLHVASAAAIHENLWTNVTAHMWASRYGIAFFENRAGEGLNYNLTIEVGSMLMTGRRCALLKDSSIDKMPTDLVGHIYKNVDIGDTASVTDAVHDWFVNDLGGARCAHCSNSKNAPGV